MYQKTGGANARGERIRNGKGGKGDGGKIYVDLCTHCNGVRSGFGFHSYFIRSIERRGVVYLQYEINESHPLNWPFGFYHTNNSATTSMLL